MRSPRIERIEAQFGAQVRQLRRAAGMSQVELARLANVSRSAILSLESGAGSSLTTLTKVLDALGQADWLLTLEPPVDTFNPLDLLEASAPAQRRRRTPRQPAAGTPRSSP